MTRWQDDPVYRAIERAFPGGGRVPAFERGALAGVDVSAYRALQCGQ
ncbi:hypothetical protein [Embleya sp. NPDC050493]